jgi:hypothetical protein
LAYVIVKVQKNQERFEIKLDTLVSAYGANVLGEHINTAKKKHPTS